MKTSFLLSSLILVSALGCSAAEDGAGNASGNATGNTNTAGVLGSGSSSGAAGNTGASGNTGGGVAGVTGVQAGGCGSNLTGVVRDFHVNYPDMEVVLNNPNQGKIYRSELGLVTEQLGTDGKPVYNPEYAATGTGTTTGAANFYNWFNTDPNKAINLASPYTLEFVESPTQPGLYIFDQSFFPIDGQSFGNEPVPGATHPDHNYHFTFELATEFVYNGGETFTFAGDDDVWVYINGKRVIDLGGVHSKLTATVELDTLGLEKGKVYPLNFFFAERHIVDSNFRIDTTLVFTDCGSPSID